MFLTIATNCLNHTLLQIYKWKLAHQRLSAAPGQTSLKFGLYAAELVPHLACKGKIMGWSEPQRSACRFDFTMMLSGALAPD